MPFAKQEHSYTWLHSMAFAPDLRYTKDRDRCIHFFLKIEGKIITHWAENWDPPPSQGVGHSEGNKGQVCCPFRVSEKFQGGRELGLVVIIIPETHPFSGRNSVFIIHFKVFSCTSSP